MFHILYISLAKVQDITRSTLIEEISALLELSNIEYYNIAEREPYLLELEVMDNDVVAVLNSLCRSAFIKRIESANTGLRVDFSRDFVCRPRPLKRIDTASAPLDPLLSRLLINLARAAAGSRGFDPFSGVGGILFEAALVGSYVVGQDRETRYIKVLRENIPLSDVLVSDTSFSIPLRDSSIDFVVSDPPYSKLSLVDVDLDHLYYSALKECNRVLRKGGYLAWTCIASLDVENLVEEFDFELVHVGFHYVHRSLLRKIVVARKV